MEAYNATIIIVQSTHNTTKIAPPSII